MIKTYKRLSKRVVAFALALVMIFGMPPVSGIHVEAAEVSGANGKALLLDTEISVTEEHLDFVFVPEKTGYYVLKSVGDNSIYEVDIHDSYEEYEVVECGEEVVSCYLQKGEKYDFDFFSGDYDEDKYVFIMSYAGTENPEFELLYEGLIYAKFGESVSLNVGIKDVEDVSHYTFNWYNQNEEKIAEGSTFEIAELNHVNDRSSYICEVTNGFFTKKAWIRVCGENDISLDREIVVSKDCSYLYTPEKSGYYVVKSVGDVDIWEVAINAVIGDNVAHVMAKKSCVSYLEAKREYRFSFGAYSQKTYKAQILYAGTINPEFQFEQNVCEIILEEGERLEATTAIVDAGYPKEGYTYKWYYASDYYYLPEEGREQQEGYPHLNEKYLTLVENANDSSYIIDNVTNAHTGTYVCEATNGYVSQKTIFRLTIYKDVQLEIGEQINFNIQPNGEIKLNISFTAGQEGYYLVKSNDVEGISNLNIKKWLNVGEAYSQSYIVESTSKIMNEIIVQLEFLGGVQPDFGYTIIKINEDDYQAEGITGEVKWIYDSNTNNLKIYGDGKMADYANGEEASQGIGVLNEDKFEDTLKEVMGDDFSDWPKVETITIESGVTRVGDYAFAGLNYLSYFAKVFVADSIDEMGQGLFDGRSTIDYYFYGTVPSFDKSFDDSLGEYANIVFNERNKTNWNTVIEKYGEVLIDEWQEEYIDLYKYEFYTSNTFEGEEDVVRLNPSPFNIPINLEVLWQDYEKNAREDSREKAAFVIEGGWYTESIEITSYNKAVVLKPALLEMIPGTYVVKVYQKAGNSLDVFYDTKVREIQAVIEETKPNKLEVSFTLNGNDIEIEEGCLDIGSFINVVDGVHEHKYEETVVNPTCVEKGFRKYICSICGDEYTDNEQEAYGHKWTEIIDKPATATSTGLKHEECTVCKAKRNENTVINKLPSSSSTEEVPPTTEQTPPVIETPSVDNNETVTYPAKGAVLKDTKSKATFTVTEEGKTVAYKGTTNKKVTSVTIPKTVTKDGVTYKVTSIAKNVFKNNKKLKKVTIGSDVTSIGTSAFQNCTALKTVKMGSKVTSVGTKAFYGCRKLTSLTIGKNVTTIGTSAFQNCTSLKKVTIPSKVKKIGAKAFYGCKKMNSITIKTTKLTTKNVGKQTFTKAGSSNYKKLTVKVPSKKLKAYKTLLKKKGLSKQAKVKK